MHITRVDSPQDLCGPRFVVAAIATGQNGVLVPVDWDNRLYRRELAVTGKACNAVHSSVCQPIPS